MPNSALPARERSPLTIHQQRPAQQRAAMRLVSTGYVTVATIMGPENVLDYIEGFKASFNRDRGRDPGLYYLRVFGEPGEQGLWGWRFGGHHISLNNLIVDGVQSWSRSPKQIADKSIHRSRWRQLPGPELGTSIGG